MTVEECRRFFAEEIRFTANVRSPALVGAFARVPREEFLGPGPWEIASADMRGLSALSGVQMSYTLVDDPRHLYHNVVVLLDKAADINNGQPSALARWVDALDLKSGERALPSGLWRRLLHGCYGRSSWTRRKRVGCELRTDLAGRAQENLRVYQNVTVHAADGFPPRS